MSNLLTTWKNNPIIVNELRSRMRGARAYWILAGYLFLLSALALIIYMVIYEQTQNYGQNYYYGGGFQQMLQASANMGKAIFYGTALLLLFIVSLLGPAFTAGSIAGERDHQTLDLLTITTLKPRAIVLGKLNAVLVFMGLLILAMLPFQSMAYFFGGVAFSEILLSILVLALTTLLFCSVGLFVSSFSRSVTIANMINYAVVVPLLLGVPFLAIVFSIFSSGLFLGPSLSDPPFILAAILSYIFLFFLSINPLTMAITSEMFIQETGHYFFSVENFFNHNIPIVAPWLIYVIFCAGVSFILISATIARLGRTQPA